MHKTHYLPATQIKEGNIWLTIWGGAFKLRIPTLDAQVCSSCIRFRLRRNKKHLNSTTSLKLNNKQQQCVVGKASGERDSIYGIGICSNWKTFDGKIEPLRETLHQGSHTKHKEATCTPSLEKFKLCYQVKVTIVIIQLLYSSTALMVSTTDIMV